MIKINLVPAEVLMEEARRRRLLQAAAVGVMLLLVFVAVSLGYWEKERRLEAQLRANEAELAKLKVIVDQVNDLQRTAEAVRHRLETVRNLLTGRFLYTVFMEDWVRSLPANIWLTSLTTSQNGTGLAVQMNGSARNQEAVAEWLRTLEASGKFTGSELGPLNLSGGGSESYYSFNLRVNYGFTPPKDVTPQ